MADQIEVSKLTEYTFYGPEAAEAAVSKLVMFAWLTPGEDESVEPSNRQGFCYGQRIRRRR